MDISNIFRLLALSLCLFRSSGDAVNASQFDKGKDMIIVFSMPKSGTSSLYYFFNESGYNAVHYLYPCDNLSYPVPPVSFKNGASWKKWTLHDTGPLLMKLYNNGKGLCPAGLYVQKAIAEGKDPFHYFIRNGYPVIIETNFRGYGKSGRAIYPQIDALDNILDAYPRATYVIYQRNITNHISSLLAWSHGVFPSHLRLAKYVPPRVAMNSDTYVIRYFIESYYRKVHDRLRSKHIPFIRADVEDNDSLLMLKARLGIRNDVWIEHAPSHTSSSPLKV